MSRHKKLMLLGVMGGSKNIEFTDDFARADGVVGNDWIGTTWTIASEKILNTPNLGDELLVDGALENWSSPTDLTSWIETLAGTSTINQETAVVQGGSNSARFDIDASNNIVNIRESLADGLQNKWVLADFWLRGSDATAGGAVYSALVGAAFYPGTDYTNYKTSTILRTDRRFYARSFSSASKSVYIDTLSVKAQTTSELILTRPQYPTSDFVLSVNIATLELSTRAGIAFCIDDPTNPLNYYLVSVCGSDFSGLSLTEIVAGVPTAIIADANPLLPTVFTANDKLTVAKSGTNLRVYKNDILVSTTKTVDAALTNNKYAGIFSTYQGNTFDGWSETVRAVGGSKTYFDAFFMPDKAYFPIGDSVTDGLTDETGLHGYPGILIDLLQVEQHNRWTETPTRLSGGGWTVAYLKTIIDDRLAAMSDTPNYITIYLGANDCTDNIQDMTEEFETIYKANYTYILDSLQTKWSNAKIYCGIDFYDGKEAVLEIMRGWNIEIVSGRSNCFEGLNGLFMDGHPEWFVDAVHPNRAGFVQIATAWKTVMGL